MGHSFSPSEEARIFSLVKKIIGTNRVASEGAQIFLNNIQRRMYLNDSSNLEDYLNFARSNPQEHGYLISSLTIHTTYWFRESSHFDYIQKHLRSSFPKGKFRALSLGSSTGEEAYSLSLVLEAYRNLHPEFDYEITGIDVDPISVATGNQAIYEAREFEKIPHQYHPFVLLGQGKTSGKMTLSKEIRNRTSFCEGNAQMLPSFEHKFDLIFCRNMLIYFDEDGVNQIVGRLAELLSSDGHLILGHSESFTQKLNLKNKGGSIFSLDSMSQESGRQTNPPPLSITPADPSYTEGKEIDLLLLSREPDDSILNKFKLAGLSYKIAKNLDNADQVLSAFPATRVLIISADSNLTSFNHAKLKTIKSNHKNMVLILYCKDQSSTFDTKGFEDIADAIVLESEIAVSFDKFLARLKKLIDIKKAGGGFSNLPIAIIDDEPYIAEVYQTILEDEGFKTVAFTSPSEFIQYAEKNPLQALITDYQMPEMTGVQIINQLQQFRNDIPVIVSTGFSNQIDPSKAYRILNKPIDPSILVETLQQALLDRYSGRFLKLDLRRISQLDLIVMGGSTGAPQVFQQILSQLPKPFPPIVVVQHIPAQFQKSFAESLAKSSGLDLSIVEDRIALKPSTIYLANSDHHITLEEEAGKIVVECNSLPPYKGLRPCVHYLFESTARLHRTQVLGVLLTGMGDDGSYALGSMKRAGQYTIAQDLTSSTVFGMPKVAIDNDGVNYIGHYEEIRDIFKQLKAA